jgi:hypothetical protein
MHQIKINNLQQQLNTTRIQYSSSDKFIPEDTALVSPTELLSLADVTDDDLESARDNWTDNPPVEKFRDLLDAT